jgi:hypothetical protein
MLGYTLSKSRSSNIILKRSLLQSHIFRGMIGDASDMKQPRNRCKLIGHRNSGTVVRWK